MTRGGAGPGDRTARHHQSDDQSYTDDFHSAIQRVAIWRLTTKSAEVESFRYPCHQCRSSARHVRTQQRTFRTLLMVPIKQVGDTVDIVTCSRCGSAQHLRDLGELLVPSTIDRYNGALVAANDHLSGRASDLDNALAELRNESSSPIRERFLGEVAATARLHGQPLDPVRAIGRQLYLSDRQIDRTLDPSG